MTPAPKRRQPGRRTEAVWSSHRVEAASSQSTRGVSGDMLPSNIVTVREEGSHVPRIVRHAPSDLPPSLAPSGTRLSLSDDHDAVRGIKTVGLIARGCGH